MIRTLSAPLLVLTFAAGAAQAQTPEAAAEKLGAFLDRIPGVGPGFAVVVVTPDDVVLRRVTGLRRASAKEPLTADTPIYIASQTKAYVGLLAAILHHEDILGLEDRMTDYWPDLELPEGVDPDAYTLRDLLSHQVPIDCDYIPHMEAYVTELDAADYPALIAEHATARQEGFEYANLGYNVWAAVLETATDKSWRTWLDEKLFGPLDMTKTSSRTSDFALDELSWSHIWQGEELGWYEVQPKTDPLMQSAGGLVTSVNDMATWLQLHLRGEALEAGITPEIVAEAQLAAVELDPGERNPYELPCGGYALGWNVCDFQGSRLYIHGGGYVGARTMMAFAPELGVGIGVFSNSDNMTGWLTSRTVVQYLQYLVEDPDAERMAEVRVRAYPERVASYLADQQQELATRRSADVWEGWKWKPSADELQQYTGGFDSGDPYLRAKVGLEDGQLVIRIGGMTARLEPARKDLFGAFSTGPFSGPNEALFERDAAGAVVGLRFQDTAFQRGGKASVEASAR